MSKRGLYGSALLEKSHKTFPFTGDYRQVMGEPQCSGIWLVYGKEKNGKTWFSLKLAEYLSSYARVLYVSGEEGARKSFQDTYLRAGLDPGNRRLKFFDYTPMSELEALLDKRKSPHVIFIDNITIYADDLKYGEVRRLQKKYQNKKLFVYIAHQEDAGRKEPYTSTGKLVKKLADIIVQVEGLACTVSGRCPGGTLLIDKKKAVLYHGQAVKNES